MTPIDELQRIIYIELSKLPQNFNIIHYRLGDTYLLTNTTMIAVKHYNHFITHYKPNDMVISDSSLFKQFIKHNHPNVICYDYPICHLGHPSSNESTIKHTLLEWFIATYSKFLKSYSIYEWNSGFIYSIHKVYNIPLEFSRLS